MLGVVKQAKGKMKDSEPTVRMPLTDISKKKASVTYLNRESFLVILKVREKVIFFKF